MTAANEQARQQALLRALRTPLPPGSVLDASQACWPALQQAGVATDAAGLRAYQLNAQATAQRVLAAAYPSIAAMVGAQALDTLALQLWRQHPPACGDLGLWGDALPDLLATHPDLQGWPWLADSARLDWACHLSARAADTSLEADSLARLADTDPQHLHIQLKPCVHVVRSPWPIVSLWQAHQLDGASQDAAVAEVLGQAQAQGQAENAVIWRHPWQIQLERMAHGPASWMAALCQASADASGPSRHDQADQGGRRAQRPASPCGLSLAAMLAQASEDFDFAAWLGEALRQGWLWRVALAD